MEQRLKERLIGAAILVALAVWLIPWILQGRAPPQDKTASVPLQLPAPKQSAPQRTQTIDLDVANDASPVAGGNEAAAAAAAGPPAPPAQTADAGAPAHVPAAAQAAQSHGDAAAARPPPQADSKPAAQPQTNSENSVQAPQAPQAPQTPPAAASSSGPKWMVQLGSFGERDNAQRLAQRVAGVGFHAKISTHRSDGQLLYRVRVGPEDTRNAAEATANDLSAHGFVAQVVTAD